MKRIAKYFSVRRVGIATLGVILFATMVIGRENEDPVPGEARKSTVRVAKLAAGTSTSDKRVIPDLDLERLNRAPPEAIKNDLFAAKSWQPPAPPSPPPPKPVAIAPPAPTAPALPFKYIGKMIDGNTTIIFLAKQDQDYSVKAGDIIEDVYRVDQVHDDAIGFTYLPLDIKQVLSINAPN